MDTFHHVLYSRFFVHIHDLVYKATKRSFLIHIEHYRVLNFHFSQDAIRQLDQDILFVNH